MMFINVDVEVLEMNVRALSIQQLEALKVVASKRADPRSTLIIKQMCNKRISEIKVSDETMFREWVKAQ